MQPWNGQISEVRRKPSPEPNLAARNWLPRELRRASPPAVLLLKLSCCTAEAVRDSRPSPPPRTCRQPQPRSLS